MWDGLIGAVAGLAGQGMSAGLQALEAKKQRDWQERMIKNRYQYQKEDLLAAGYNPALAYGQQPPGTPSGAQAQMPRFDAVEGFSKARQATLAREQAKSAQADQALKLSSAKAADEQAELTRLQQDALSFQAEKNKLKSEMFEKALDAAPEWMQYMWSLYDEYGQWAGPNSGLDISKRRGK